MGRSKKRGSNQMEAGEELMMSSIIGSSYRNWFEGKWVYIRGKEMSDYMDCWQLVHVPLNLLYHCFIQQQQQQTTQNNNSNNNHSLHHVFPCDLALPYIDIRQQYFGADDASWVSLGSDIYIFGGTRTNDDIFHIKGNPVDSISFSPAGRLISGRKAPKVVELDRKVYIFGGSEELFGEVFVPRPASRKGQCRPLSSSLQFSGAFDILFAVAVEKESKIVMGLNYKNEEGETTSVTAFLVYNVINDSWEKHKIKFRFNLRSPLCQPIAVGSCLYWLDTKMRAYDLNSQQCFEGPIEEGLETHENDSCNLQVCLVHLVGDNFCIIWVDGHNPKVLHYTMMQALRTTTKIKGNRFRLSTIVFSCLSFTSGLSLCLHDRAIVL